MSALDLEREQAAPPLPRSYVDAAEVEYDLLRAALHMTRRYTRRKVQLSSPRYAWHRLANGNYRVTVTRWGARDVATRRGVTCRCPRAGWAMLAAQGAIPRGVAENIGAYRTFLALGYAGTSPHQ